MDETAAGQFFKDLTDFFDRKPVSDSTFVQWFDNIKGIPAPALPYLKREMCNLERFPTNVPAMMWTFYMTWRKGREASEKEEGCSKCHMGWIDAWKIKPDYPLPLTFAFRCGYCHAHKDKPNLPMATRAELIGRGYLIEEPEFPKAVWVDPYPWKHGKQAKPEAPPDKEPNQATLNDDIPF